MKIMTFLQSRIRIRALLTLSLAVALSGCGGGVQELGNAQGTLGVVDALPEPVNLAAGDSSDGFRLGADDIVAVTVVGQPDISVLRVRLDKSGRLGLPVAGVIAASGMTIAQLTEEIERRLRAAYFRDPQVAVQLLEAESAKITVDGQVLRPGLYPVIPEMTLMQAVASAQGTTETARLNEVVIFRTVEGKRYAALYDLRAIRRGNYPDPSVFADDIVLIGDSAARRLFRDFIQIIPLLTTPIIVAFQN
jgi:polysaccharide biosynthesis/export protein